MRKRLPAELRSSLHKLSEVQLDQVAQFVAGLLAEQVKEENASGSSSGPGDMKPGAVWYRQEKVRCGKPGCKKCAAEGKGHGPYWYAYTRVGGKLRARYIGKERPGN